MACVPSDLEVVPRLKPKLGNSWHPQLLWRMWSFVEQEAMPLGAQTSSHRSTVLFKVRSHVMWCRPWVGLLSIDCKDGGGGTGIWG